MAARFRPLPKRLAALDLTLILDKLCVAENVVGYTNEAGIACRRWALTLVDISVEVDFKGGMRHIQGQGWEIRGDYAWEDTRVLHGISSHYVFKVSGFRGNIDACARDFTALRVCMS